MQHPTWLPFLSESSPHVTVSVAEGVPAKEAGELVAAARAGSRARIVPLVGLKLLHGGVAGRQAGSTGWDEPHVHVGGFGDSVALAQPTTRLTERLGHQLTRPACAWPRAQGGWA